METAVYLFIAVLVLVILLMGIKIHILRKSVKEISRQFTERLETDTNSLIYVSGRDKYIRQLAENINIQLKKLRRESIRFHNGNTELKTAVTNISHDLRTPLTSICGYLDLLENENTPENTQRYLSVIRNRTEALKQLTEELFRYSLDVSSDSIHLESTDICPILEQSLLSFYGVFTKRGITPEIDISESPIIRTIDKSVLSRILSNIIGNGVKYSDGDFSVSTDNRGAIVFSNTANNLDAVSVGKLFDRFYTVQASRNSTGLGLSIAKYLTELMNGTISADYKNKKLYITLYFPESK